MQELFRKNKIRYKTKQSFNIFKHTKCKGCFVKINSDIKVIV